MTMTKAKYQIKLLAIMQDDKLGITNKLLMASDVKDARIAELENRIKNAIDSVNATENVLKCARVDTYKALERIKYILTAPPEEVK